MPKPPVDPGYFDKVNFVIDAWTNPCVAPWYIYIETMGPAALQAFITLITFGWDDVARGYFRPKGLRGKRHGRKGKRTGRLARFFPEIGEEVGKRLPGAKPIGAPQWTAVGRALWRIDSVLQRGLFYWLVADVTIDFAFEWTSLLYESEWCKTAGQGQFSYRTDGPFEMHEGHWDRVSYELEDYEEGPPTWGSNSGQSGGPGCSVTATLGPITRAGGIPAGGATLRIRSLLTGTVYASTGFVDFTEQPRPDVLLKGNVPPNTEFIVEVFASGDPGEVYGGEGVVVGIVST